MRVAKSKKGDLYAQGQLEDMNGSVDVLCFAEPYRRLAEKLKLDVPVLVKGGVRVEEGSNPKLMISDITPLEEAQPKLPPQPAHQGAAGDGIAKRPSTLCTRFAASARARRECCSIWSARATSRW